MEDCLIVGGGVVGLSLAYELASHGASVRLLERSTVGREASWAGAGILPPGNIASPRSADERLIRMCHELHPCWSDRLREETGIDNGYSRTGGIYLARGQKDADELAQQVIRWNEQGIASETVQGSRLAEIEPALSSAPGSRPFRAAVFAPDEAQLRNPRHLRALYAACCTRGVVICEGESGEDFEIVGRKIAAVCTATERYVAGAVCVTSGAWSGPLLTRLGVSVPLRPIRGQIALVNCGAPVLRRVVNEGKLYLVPRADGRVLVGSTEEDVGFVKRNTAEAIGELLRFAGELAPDLASSTVETCWSGLRPRSHDERPYLGRVADLENAFVAAGHFRAGLQLSPGTAVVMRQLILGQTPEIDLAPFDVHRHQAEGVAS